MFAALTGPKTRQEKAAEHEEEPKAKKPRSTTGKPNPKTETKDEPKPLSKKCPGVPKKSQVPMQHGNYMTKLQGILKGTLTRNS